MTVRRTVFLRVSYGMDLCINVNAEVHGYDLSTVWSRLVRTVHDVLRRLLDD